MDSQKSHAKLPELKSITHILANYFRELVVPTGNYHLYTLVDPETKIRATCCTQIQVAAIFSLDQALNGGNGSSLAKLLLNDANFRQSSNGALTSSYNRATGENELADIAEIGASANPLYFLHQVTGSNEAKEILVPAAEYLLTQVSSENPGAVYKSSQATHLDILNGDIYAALALARAFKVTGDERFLHQVNLIVNHVQNRFGIWKTGWWPYAERWDGTVAVGASVAYQATIIAFGMPVSSVLSTARAQSWNQTLEAALQTLNETLPHGPTDESESPAWSRDWDNVWEIPQAYAQFLNNDHAHHVVRTRLERIDKYLSTLGVEALRPKPIQSTGRTPVTSMYRKAATFAAFICDIAEKEGLFSQRTQES